MLTGCSENEISFENTIDANYANPNSPADQSCHVFEPEGAGLEWREFGNTNLTATSSNISFVHHLTIEGIEEDSASELIFATRISASLCEQINIDRDISTTLAAISNNEADWDYYYVGSFASTLTLGSTSGESPAMEGQYAGCLADDSNHYVYYHVLHAR